MEDEKTKGYLLGDLECALDFVHSVDAAALLGMNDVNGRSSAAAHLEIGEYGRVHGEGLDGIRTEPIRQLSDMGPTTVVEVLPGREQLHALGFGAGKGIEDSGMQALLQKDVRRDDVQHEWKPKDSLLSSHLMSAGGGGGVGPPQRLSADSDYSAATSSPFTVTAT